MLLVICALYSCSTEVIKVVYNFGFHCQVNRRNKAWIEKGFDEQVDGFAVNDFEKRVLASGNLAAYFSSRAARGDSYGNIGL
jgi:hypothetical protein